MTFLAPGWLLLGALAGVVLILHARRRRIVEIPSVMLWHLIGSRSARRRRLHWPPPSLLLLLQLLIVLTVAAALAQPRFGSSDRVDHWIFAIDASGSMRATDVAPSRFDAARIALAERLDDLKMSGVRVSVIVAGGAPTLLTARQVRASAVEPRVDTLEPGDGTANWIEALSWLDLVLRPGETSRLVILSDQAATAARIATEAHPSLSIDSIVFANEAVPNAALVASVQPIDLAAGRWQVEGEVAFLDAEPTAMDIAVLFEPTGSEGYLDWGAIRISAEDERSASGDLPRSIAFSSELILPGSGRLILQIATDAGPHDNQVQFALGDAPREVKILLVGEAERSLVAALSAIEDVRIDAAEILPAGGPDYDLVIVNDTTIERMPETNVLWLGRGRMAQQNEPSTLTAAELTGWRSDHVLSDGVAWWTLPPVDGYAFERLPGMAVLAESENAHLVQARTTSRGREVRIALDLATPDWTSDPAFPTLIANIIDWLGIERGGAAPTPCVAGEPCAIEARYLSHAITGPDGELVSVERSASEWLPGGTEASFTATRAGFYRIVSDRGEMFVAVNPSAEESALGSTQQSSTEAGEPLSLWWWFALAALLLVAVEAVVAGRGRERFLRLASLQSGVPYANRRRALLVTRVTVILLLASTLLTLPFLSRSPTEGMVVVLGPSVDPSGASQRDALIDALVDRLRVDPVGIGWVTSGGTARIVADVDRGAAEIDQQRLRRGSDLDASIALALAMLPADLPGRIAVVTGGHEGDGMIGFQTRGPIAVDLVPVNDLPVGEVLVAGIAVPDRVLAGEAFPVNAILFSERDTPAEATIFVDGDIVVEEAILIEPGLNRIEVTLPPAEAGEIFLEVMIASDTDVISENNRNGAIVRIEPEPEILIVSPDLGWGEMFAGAIGIQGLPSDVVTPSGAPRFLDGWLSYDQIILMDMPAIDLSTRQLEQLAEAVETHGRGLFILGGEHAFGPGGYYETPLEQLSPLSSRIPHETPRVALVLVIDRSGSMQALVEDVTRLDIAKAATLAAVDVLHEESQVGVVVFDTLERVVVPLQERKDINAVAAALAPIEPGGGTALYPALEAALAELEGADADAKHIVILTDGLVEPVDFGPLMAAAAGLEVTMSTVAIGAVAITDRLETIAALGGGRFHATADIKALPSILTQEALLLSTSPVEHGTAPVFWTEERPAFLAGLPDLLPPLQTYVRTTAKPAADVHMALLGDAGEEIPVLASWRYGNGQVLAFATHGAGPGTEAWRTLPQYPLLWAQTIRQFLPTVAGPGLHLTARLDGDDGLVVANLLSADGAPMSGRKLSVSLEGSNDVRELIEITPGQYQARFALPGPGVYRFTVDAGEMTATAAVYLAHPSHLNFGRTSDDALALPALTGGDILSAEDAAFDVDFDWLWQPEWRFWLLAALALFIVELAIREGAAPFGRRRFVPD